MNNERVLDLRFNGQMDAELSILFNKISNDLKHQFNSLITDLSIPNKNNIDWWVSELPSRNTLASPFFHYFCCIHFVDELVKNDKLNFEIILVDILNLKKVLDVIIYNNNSTVCKLFVDTKIRLRITQFLKKYFGEGIIFFYNSVKLFIAKRIFKQKKFDNIPLTLIDTFVIPGYTNSRRWYGSLWENLSPEMHNQTYFVSTVTKSSISNLFTIYSQLNANKENYIIKEAYLHISDLLFAFNYKRRVKNFKVKKIEILNQDITRIVEECLFNPKDIYTIQESLLTYRFIHRLEQKGVQVRLSIDWFEGQIIDKAWNLGFHTFYPETKTVAYRAFEISPLYLCSFPIPIEGEAGVIPQVFALQGSKMTESVKVFMPDLKSILIPSYKSEHVWKRKSKNDKTKSNNIIVALPISNAISRYVIAMIIETSKKISHKNTSHNFILKTHPTISTKELYNLSLKTLPPNVVFTTEKSFPALLHSAKVLITEASSTCLEAIAIGVPVILIKREYGLFHSPLPEGIDKILYKVCSSANDLIIALNEYLSMSKLEQEKLIIKGHTVRDNYFEPITKEGTNRFMNFKQTGNHNYA
jgi:hypothetical protein